MHFIYNISSCIVNKSPSISSPILYIYTDTLIFWLKTCSILKLYNKKDISREKKNTEDNYLSKKHTHHKWLISLKHILHFIISGFFPHMQPATKEQKIINIPPAQQQKISISQHI